MPDVSKDRLFSSLACGQLRSASVSAEKNSCPCSSGELACAAPGWADGSNSPVPPSRLPALTNSCSSSATSAPRSSSASRQASQKIEDILHGRLHDKHLCMRSRLPTIPLAQRKNPIMNTFLYLKGHTVRNISEKSSHMVIVYAVSQPACFLLNTQD